MFLLAITSGAAGAAIHALTAWATYAGNRQLVSSWLPWIYLRIPIGVLLSILVYLGLRAGIFDTSYMRGEGGVFAVAFVCAISGLFSKQVTDKLSDLIDNLLVPASKPARGDSLEDVAHGPGSSAEVVQPQGVPEETIQAVQRNLIMLGYLRETNDQGTPADDGIVGTSTHDAIESFLSAHGIVGQTRAATLGEETDPDYWPNLRDLLEQDVKTKNNQVMVGHSANS